MGVYAPPVIIDPPAIQPYRFGLLSVATVVDHQGDDHELNGITYRSLACAANLEEFVAVCPTANNPSKVATDDARTTVVTDGAFELYANLSCKQTTLEAMFQEARDIFALGEPKAFEAAFWTKVLALPTATVLNTTPGPAGALSVTSAIAALESFMGCCYPGRAVFHSDRATVPFAAADHELIRQAGTLETVLGSGWAAYACSPNTGPDGTVAPDGHAWLYATSQPIIHRWPAHVLPDNVTHVLKRDANGGQTNEPQVIVERSYLAYTECCVAAVLVCLGACE